MSESEVYKFEDIARIGIINTGGNSCSVGCTYCFYRYKNPQNFAKNSLLTMDKFLEILDYVPTDLPQVSIEGLWVDPFMNKHVYDFIIEASRRFPNSDIMTCTHGILMTEQGIKRLRDLPNFYVCLSLNTFNRDIRNWISKIDNYDIVIKIIEELRTHPLITDFGDTDLVIKDYCTWKEMARDKHDNLHLRRMEYNKHFPEDVKKFSIDGSATIYSTAKRLADMGVKTVVLGLKLHELLEFYNEEYDYSFRNGLKELHHVINKMTDDDILITTSLSSEYIEQHIKHGKMLVIKNNMFGGNYDSCGFLTFKDINEQLPLLSKGMKYGKIYIPSQMFRLSDNDGTGRKYDLIGDSLYDQPYNYVTHDIHRVTSYNNLEYVREISKEFVNSGYYPMRW